MSELSAHATELERLVEAAAPLAQVEQALDRLESARLSLFGRITCWLDQLP
jgi:hypothetical protein